MCAWFNIGRAERDDKELCGIIKRICSLLSAMMMLLCNEAAARYHHKPWPDDVPSPQYINVAPLPGAGIALNEQGDPDGLGAFQINIPVAYTPRNGYLSLSAYKGKHPNDPGLETDNGTGVFALAFGNNPSLYASAMQVSSILSESKALSFQLSVIRETPKHPALAVGIQDLLEKEPRMQSLYFVTTKRFQFVDRHLFATVGYGGGRFLDGPIAGVSTPLSESTNLALEWDGYQINSGLGWRPGGRHGWLTLLGAYNGKTGWLFGGAIAFKL